MLIIISLILDYKQKGFDPGLLLREKIYWAHDYKKKKKHLYTPPVTLKYFGMTFWSKKPFQCAPWQPEK